MSAPWRRMRSVRQVAWHVHAMVRAGGGGFPGAPCAQWTALCSGSQAASGLCAPDRGSNL